MGTRLAFLLFGWELDWCLCVSGGKSTSIFAIGVGPRLWLLRLGFELVWRYVWELVWRFCVLGGNSSGVFEFWVGTLLAFRVGNLLEFRVGSLQFLRLELELVWCFCV